MLLWHRNVGMLLHTIGRFFIPPKVWHFGHSKAMNCLQKGELVHSPLLINFFAFHWIFANSTKKIGGIFLSHELLSACVYNPTRKQFSRPYGTEIEATKTTNTSLSLSIGSESFVAFVGFRFSKSALIGFRLKTRFQNDFFFCYDCIKNRTFSIQKIIIIVDQQIPLSIHFNPLII